jgi:hypothetical protein
VEPNREQLVRYVAFDLRRPHGVRHGWRALRARHENARQVDSGHSSERVGATEEIRSDDIDADEVTAVLLYAAAFFGFLVMVALAAAAVFVLSALRHW